MSAPTSVVEMAVGPGILLATTHLLWLLVIARTMQLGVPSFLLAGFLTMCASTYYHMCQCFSSTCLQAVPYTMARRFDYAFASNMVAQAVLLLFTNFPSIRMSSDGIYASRYPNIPSWANWREVFVAHVISVLLTVFYIVLFLTTADVLTVANALLVVVSICVAVVAKLILVDARVAGSLPLWKSRVRVVLVVPAAVIIIAGFVFFVFENLWLHALWHIFVFAGAGLLLIGSTPAYVTDALYPLSTEGELRTAKLLALGSRKHETATAGQSS